MGAKRESRDVLDAVGFQDDVIEKLTLKWRDAERRLAEEGGVDPRWDRGSAIKLLLMHMAVREAARIAVALRLREIGNAGLAEAFEEGGSERRAAIDQLEEQLRGLWAIDAFTRELIDAAENVVRFGETRLAENAIICCLPQPKRSVLPANAACRAPARSARAARSIRGSELVGMTDSAP